MLKEEMKYASLVDDILEDELAIDEREEFFINEKLKDFVVSKTNKKAFDKIMDFLGYPLDYLQERKNLEQVALENIDSLDDSDKKDLVSQIYFGDYAKNIKFDIETILERVESNDAFKNKINGHIIKFLKEIDYFLDDDTVTKDLIAKLKVFDMQLQANNNSLKSLIHKTFLLAKEDFFNEIKKSVNSSDILRGIEPKIIGDNVQFYTLQNQTENQKNFYLLTRTNYIKDYLLTKDAFSMLEKDLATNDYLSYSLNNAEIFDGFASKHRVIFGYNDLNSSSLMSSNVYDGQTNQYALKDDFYVMKQQYLGIESFLNQTEKYNELVLKNNKGLKPSYIIVNDAIPSETIIKIARNMGIPIVYLDPAYYKSHERYENENKMEKWYNHDSCLDYDLFEIIKNNDRKR